MKSKERKEQVAVRLPGTALVMIDDLVGSIYGTNRGDVARTLILDQLKQLATDGLIKLRLADKD